MHVPKDKKSNSLEGHASGRGDYPDPLYPPNAEVRSLDMKVQDMLNKRIAGNKCRINAFSVDYWKRFSVLFLLKILRLIKLLNSVYVTFVLISWYF